MHLFKEPVPSVFEKEAREFFYAIKFVEDGLSLSALVQGIKIKLDEEILGMSLDIPIIGVRFVKNQQPSVEFMQTATCRALIF